ncbi:MAG: cytochrome ubiquinol oxidase subunit I [Desulfurococcales archaeon]|nr:cytochrome ubiquinol oxidase subunit I [Desulfurococcales archaeon]
MLTWTTFWLALVFSFHIVMVNLGIFLALYVPLLKYRADKKGDKPLDAVAYKLMKFYAATYGVAGVFATAFTVFLLSFYPDFLGLAGNITLIPFGLAIIMIVVHFFSITGFYYGWHRWSRGTHYLFGFLLGLSAVLIPFAFRAVFAFLNIPVGLELAGGKLSLNVGKALTNPTFPPLYLKSLTAAITAGAFAVAGGLAFSAAKSNDAEYKRAVGVVTRDLAPVIAAGLVLMIVFGLWYAISLQDIPYKFNNVFARLGWKAGDGTIAHDLSWLFVLKMLFFAFQIYVIAVVYKYLKSGEIPLSKASLALYGGLAALFTVALGELLNAFSQYPYFIACLGSPQPCQDLLAQIPKSQLQYLADVLNLETYNTLAVLEGVKIITSLFMIFLIASTFYFFYVYFFKKEQA